ncbi:MAG: VanW family protein [Anaerolineae bacterium]
MTTLNKPYTPPAPNPWLIRIPVLFITGGVLVLLALVLLLVAFHAAYTDRITPGVRALGVDLSGMTHEEATAALASRFNYDSAAVFTFRYGEEVWQMTAGELGVTFDVNATVDQALAVSNGQGMTGALVDQALAWFNGQSVAPIIRYDQTHAVNQLTAIAQQIERPAQDASLIINGTDVQTTPAQVGRVLDIPATLGWLDNIILTLAPAGEVPLVVYETAPTIWNADEAATQIRAALSGPLELFAESPAGEQLGPWTASVEQIAALLQTTLVENGDGTRSYQVSIDMSAFADYLSQLAPGLIAAPANGRFHFDEATGQLINIQPAINGRELNVDETLKRLEQAVFRYDSRSVPMAFNYTLPRYHNGITAAELGITQLVAESTTYYTGSTPSRRHNIAEGLSRFDGVIIAPGEEFSFNELLGDVSLEAGFLESKVIEGERTVDGIGGGICQVSTTIFRAAFSGGYTIIERNAHAYRVGFYELNGPPGLDAAIWTPDRDFRFQNDTPYHLLMETSIYPASETLQFRFYSTNPGRIVEIQEPVVRNQVSPLPTRYEANTELQFGEVVQADWAAEGADVNVKRIIRDLNGNVLREDNIFTHYLPWGAIFQVAPGDSRLSST